MYVFSVPRKWVLTLLEADLMEILLFPQRVMEDGDHLDRAQLPLFF
jgi:hypothetical protein